jgi:tetratricopeptide (TPR) repeat protein
MRRLRVLVLVASMLASVALPATAPAQDDDWSVTRGRRPGRGSTRPSPGTRPSGGPSRTPARRPPPTVTPAQNNAPPAAAADRRGRMITALTESVLRGATEDGGPLPVLLRLVRERDGSIDGLVTEFETRARAAANEIGPHLALGHLYREAGRFEEALGEYATAERIAPTHPAPARATGALLRRMDRHPEARAAFDRALSRTTDRARQAELLRQLVELALEGRDVPAARGYHSRLVALDRASMTVRRELADALLQRHLYADAIAEFQSLARALAGDNRVLPPVLRDLGRAYAGNQQLDEALASYRRALSLAGSDAGVRRELYEAMTEVYTARNALPAWIAELERLGAGRDAYDRAVLLGRLHDQAGNTQAAIAAYRRALAARPSDIDAHLRIAQLYQQQGLRAEQIGEYRRLVVLAPREPRFVVELAELLLQQGQRDEAWRMLAQASARAGSDPNVHERLAEVYARHGRQQEALREIELVARFDPNSPAALTALGRQYMEMGQRDRALATWRRMLDGARDRARGAVALAEVYADNAMLPESIEMYEEAVRLRPTEVDYYRGLATVLERAQRFEHAIVAWRKVIELGQSDRDVRRHARESIVRLWSLRNRLPQEIARLEGLFAAATPDLESARDLAEAYVRARRPEDAERVLRRIVELDPADVATLVTLERVLTARGELAGAIETLRRLAEADPRRAREWYQRMAQHALALHRDEEAIEFATRAVQLNDQDATAHLRLAELYRARNDMGPAIAALRRALELNDRLYPTYFELADLYLGFRNEPREAIALYRRVIQLAPDDDYVYRAGRRAVQLAAAAGASEEVERELTTAAASQPGRAVFRRLLVAWYDSAARPLINRVQQGSAEEARRARQELTRLGSRALAPLLDALGERDPAQQRIALDILGYLGNPNAAPALVTLAESASETEIKLRALAAAGALGEPRVLPRLIALQGQNQFAVATLATWAIGHVHTPAATRALVQSLGVERSAEVRTMAALALAGTRDGAARAALRAVLASDSQSAVRAAAAYALGSGIDRAAVPTLLAALETGPWMLRAAAATALGANGEAGEVATALARALFSPQPAGSNEPSLRRASARALARLAGAAGAASGRAFDDPSLGDRGSRMLEALLDPAGEASGGAMALVRFRREITGAARAALEGGLRENVMAVLAALEEPGALAPLASVEEVARVEGAREALRELIADLVPALGVHVGHYEPAIRRGALRVLASSEVPAAVAALARAAGDADVLLATLAVQALGRHGSDPAAYEALAARLERTVPWEVRTAAATALATVRDARAALRLTTALREDEFEYVRVAAARALGAHRTEAGVREALEQAVRSDPDASVRREAQAALE